MPSNTPQYAIAYPNADDKIKDQTTESKLAQDLSRLALSTESALSDVERRLNDAIALAGPERGLMPYNTDVSTWTTKEHEGWWDIDNAARANSIIGLPTEAAGMPGRFYHSAAANNIPFQEYRTYGNWNANNQQGVYYRTIKWFGQPYAPWVNLAKGGSWSAGASPEHMMRESELRRRRGKITVQNKAAVAIIYDHGTNNYKNIVHPLMKARALQGTLALNSQMYDPSQPRYVHDNQTTWDMVKTWATEGIEIANHGRTHANFQDAKDIEFEVRTGREELETSVGLPVDSYVQVGLTKPAFGGFDNGETAEAYWKTAAGQIILSSHAVATGMLPGSKLYPLDGTITQGMQGVWIDGGAAAISTAKTQIQAAIAGKQAILIRCHPEVLNTGTNTTTAQLAEFLDWLKQRVTASEVDVLQLRDLAIAQSKSDAIVRETAGRTVSVWDYLNNREQLIYGDTGWRSLTVPNMAPLDGSGTIKIRRVNDRISLQFDGVGYTGTGVSEYLTAAGFIPAGFQPGYGDNPASNVGNVNANKMFILGILQATRIRLLNSVSGWPGVGVDALRGQLTWTTTQTWPTTLPGVAA